MTAISYARQPGRPAIKFSAPELPYPPDLSSGKCSSPNVDASWWSSPLARERQVAVLLCQGCPCQQACREYGLAMPSTDTSTIYGGLSAAERIRLRRERQQAAQLRPWGSRLISAMLVAWPVSMTTR